MYSLFCFVAAMVVNLHIVAPSLQIYLPFTELRRYSSIASTLDLQTVQVVINTRITVQHYIPGARFRFDFTQLKVIIWWEGVEAWVSDDYEFYTSNNGWNVTFTDIQEVETWKYNIFKSLVDLSNATITARMEIATYIRWNPFGSDWSIKGGGYLAIFTCPFYFQSSLTTFPIIQCTLNKYL